MKKCLLLAGILLAINVAITVAFLVVLPDQVPVHFGAAGEANRIGSKMENLAFPALALFFGIACTLFVKYGEEGNRRTMSKVNVGMQVVFILAGLFVYLNQLSYNGTADTPGSSSFDMSQVSALVIGVTLIVMGNFMPKSTRNALFGIRMPWTQKSDEAWARAHRLGGYVSIAAGVLMVLAGILLTGSAAFSTVTLVFIVWAVGSLVGSYRVCKDVD